MNRAVACTLVLCVAGLLPAQEEVDLVNAFPNISFTNPVFLTHAGDGSDRIFVVERQGIIRVFPNDPDVSTTDVFLDIGGRVNSDGGEMGLLGLAFYPDFQNNDYFYVNYTAGSGSSRRTVVSRFNVDAQNPNQADANSEFMLLQVSQPFSNHNAGMIAFGPDGYLYIALGDGGSGGDPEKNGQDPQTLLGSILRIDVDNPDAGLNYGIPSDNPFVNNPNGRDEIFAYGFRNPWRFSFDFETGQLWAGDVGQSDWEEIDLVEIGENYGWNIMEGKHCYPPSISNCDMSGLTLPVVEYPQENTDNCSVTGGYVYRGALRPEFDGAYIYGDYCSARIWLLRYESGKVTADSLLFDGSFALSSFGVDQNNELYFLQYGAGDIYRFSEGVSHVGDEEGASPKSFVLYPNFPNPFNPTTTIRYDVARTGHVELQVFNLLGQRIRTLVAGELEPGSYSVTWDGRSHNGSTVPSGVYWLRLQADEFVQTRKMVLIR